MRSLRSISAFRSLICCSIMTCFSRNSDRIAEGVEIMYSRLLKVLVSAGILMAVGLPVAAHHSFSAEFDQNKKVTLDGKVVQMEWVNPHSWLTIDVPKL